MTKQFVKKNIELSLDFESYLAKHPELYRDIPDGAVIVFTIRRDDKFNKDSISIVRKHVVKEPVVRAEKASSKWTISPLELKTA